MDEDIRAAVEEMLRAIGERNLIPTAEVRDMLLDIHSLTRPPEIPKEEENTHLTPVA